MGVSDLRIRRRPDSRLRIASKNSVRNWRAQVLPDSRQRIVNKIIDTLMRQLPIRSPEGLHEIKKIAVRFEEKMYAAATNQSDYLRRISLKMLRFEAKQRVRTEGMANSLPSNSAGTNNPAVV